MKTTFTQWSASVKGEKQTALLLFFRVETLIFSNSCFVFILNRSVCPQKGQITFPEHGNRADLGTRLLHNDLAESPAKRAAWQLRSRLHRLILHGTSDFRKPSVRNISYKIPTVLETKDKRGGLIYLLSQALANPHSEYCMNSASSSSDKTVRE